jgi:hypothetical protein
MPILVVYSKPRARELLHAWTPQQLCDALKSGQFGATLTTGESEELEKLLHEWMQRALGSVTLRDALWVDPHRGARVYDLVCAALTVERCVLPPAAEQVLSELNGVDMSPQQVRDMLANGDVYSQDMVCESQRESQHSQGASPSSTLHDVVERAESLNLPLTWYHETGPHYPFPHDLDLDLDLDSLPCPHAGSCNSSETHSDQSVNWRRTLAVLLVCLGCGGLGVRLLVRHAPPPSTRFSPGLLTLGTLVGIRAGWPGYTGGLCLWLASLPHSSGQEKGRFLVWKAALFVFGVVFLFSDRQVRVWLHMGRARSSVE